ncbi:MAG: hypothetical protein IJM55_01465 [Ruminococcus sp.]|nr:hypothetical protein [Ruminococcus sp.]
MCIAWDDMTRTDEFGYKSPLSEELTAKQADAINEEIAGNGLSGVVDADAGGLLFDETVSETERFRTALWLKKN